MTGLLPCHKYRCKTEHQHHQQIIQKITPVDTESKLHYKIINRLHESFDMMQLLFTEQIDQKYYKNQLYILHKNDEKCNDENNLLFFQLG